MTMPTIPTDLRARIESALTAAEAMTPGPWTARLWSLRVSPWCDDMEPMASIRAPSGGDGGERRPVRDVATVHEDGMRPDEQEANAAGIVALRNAAPDLRALLALLDAPAGLTVGAALADPRVQDGSHEVHATNPDGGFSPSIRIVGDEIRWMLTGSRGWREEYGLSAKMLSAGVYAWPCRLVPIPNERGAL